MDKNWSDIVTIKGVADANSQIKLYDGNTSLGTVYGCRRHLVLQDIVRRIQHRAYVYGSADR